ncbi:LysR family transcriptional regulator [Luteitalea sp.]|uniref:LysR family transcriptional regulator n=1 Tax=Luteitalea sp. TaxID=2004800 RepID=UPI000AC9C245|nr:LysR family transcriptional regulator [Luteitalea sp.]
MHWLNYHHLLYFWTVVREGSVSKAAVTLHLSQPTVSAQVRMLEQALGQQLFLRKGRTQLLTDVGRTVYGYADDIFGIGREMMKTLEGRGSWRAAPLTVGIANAVPKLVVYRLLRPVITQPDPMRLVCLEDDPEQLIAKLATYTMDVVIANVQAPAYLPIKVFNHLLGESDIAFFAPAAVARRLRRQFPRSLHKAPMLMPTTNSPLRHALEDWFGRHKIAPAVVGEFEDSALMKVFGQAAGCVFPAPAAVADDVAEFYGGRFVGKAEGVRERYYVISVERRLRHPGVVAMTDVAREEIFR